MCKSIWLGIRRGNSGDLYDQQFGKDDNLGAHEPICEHVRDHGGNNRAKVTQTALSFLVSITFVTSLKSWSKSKGGIQKIKMEI